MSERGTVVYRSYDPIDLELAESRLRAADVPHVRIGRGNAALLGVGDNIIEQLIEVPPEYAEQARALLASPDEDEEDEEEDDEPEVGQPPATMKALLTALGLGLIVPGLGIAYAGLPATGLIVAAWSFVAFLSTSVASDPVAAVVFSQVIARIVDVVFAQVWLRRYGRTGPGALGQLTLATVLVTAFFLGERYAGPAISGFLWSLPAPEEDSGDEQDS